MQESIASKKDQYLKEWIEDFSDEMYQWAFYKTSEEEVAKDLLQETFLSAYASIETFKGLSSPKTWLFRILNNKIIDYYRKQSKELLASGDELIKKNVAFSDSFFDATLHWKPNGLEAAWEQDENLLDDEEFILVLEECLRHLPVSWKNALLWKFMDQKKSSEICKELNLSQSNYWQVIHRSKLIMKKCLEVEWFTKN